MGASQFKRGCWCWHLTQAPAAAELFARQLLARVALRVAEELQRPPRRLDEPGGMAGPDRPQYGNYNTQI